MKSLIEKYKSLKLNTKFTLVVILLIAIPMLVFVFLFLKFTKQGMMYQIINDLNSSIGKRKRSRLKKLQNYAV